MVSGEESDIQRAPSGPAAMMLEVVELGGSGKSVTTPNGVIRPNWAAPPLNQRLQSGPVVIHGGLRVAWGSGKWAIVPTAPAATRESVAEQTVAPLLEPEPLSL